MIYTIDETTRARLTRIAICVDHLQGGRWGQIESFRIPRQQGLTPEEEVQRFGDKRRELLMVRPVA